MLAATNCITNFLDNNSTFGEFKNILQHDTFTPHLICFTLERYQYLSIYSPKYSEFKGHFKSNDVCISISFQFNFILEQPGVENQHGLTGFRTACPMLQNM